MRIEKILGLVLASLLLVVAGAAGGYVYAHERDSSASVTREPTASKDDRDVDRDVETLLKLTTEICHAATELRSAYTRRVIGHSERCLLSPREGASGSASSHVNLLASICSDIRKATRTAHLPDASCPEPKAVSPPQGSRERAGTEG